MDVDSSYGGSDTAQDSTYGNENHLSETTLNISQNSDNTISTISVKHDENPYCNKTEITLPVNCDETDFKSDSSPKVPHYLSTTNLKINETLEHHSNLEAMSKQYRSTSYLNAESPQSHRKSGLDNPGFHADEEPGTELKSSFDEKKPYNGDLNSSPLDATSNTPHLTEAINLELVNMKPMGKDVTGAYENGKSEMTSIPLKPHGDVEMGSPYDEYFVPVNEHKKFMRGEKLYVTMDKRTNNKKSKCLCWGICIPIVAAVVILGILAAVGVIGNKPAQEVSSRQFSGSYPETKKSIFFGLPGGEESEGTTTSSERVPYSSTSGPWSSTAFVPLTTEMSQISVPQAIESQIKITNLEFDPEFSQKNSTKFKELAEVLGQQLKETIFTSDELNNGPAAIEVKVVELMKGSVVARYRIVWKFKEPKPTEQDPINMASLEKRIAESMKENNGLLGVFEINQDASVNETTKVLDSCKIQNFGCEHECIFDYETADFSCTCPEGQVLDVDGKHCTYITSEPHPEPSMEEHPEHIPEPTIEPTSGPHPEPASEPNAEPTSESHPGSHEEPISEPHPEPTSEPHAEPTTQPHPEPNSEPHAEPTSEPHEDLSSKSHLDYVLESHQVPTSEPNTEPQAEPTSEPHAEPTSGPNAEPTSKPHEDTSSKSHSDYVLEPHQVSTSEPNAEPTPEPQAEPTSEPHAEPTSGPNAEPTSRPHEDTSSKSHLDYVLEPHQVPTSEPNAEPTPEPQAEPTSEPNSEPNAEPTSEPHVETSSKSHLEYAVEPHQVPTSETNAEPTSEPRANTELTLQTNPEPTSEPHPETTAEPISAEQSELINLDHIPKMIVDPTSELQPESTSELSTEQNIDKNGSSTSDAHPEPTSNSTQNSTLLPNIEHVSLETTSQVPYESNDQPSMDEQFKSEPVLETTSQREPEESLKNLITSSIAPETHDNIKDLTITTSLPEQQTSEMSMVSTSDNTTVSDQNLVTEAIDNSLQQIELVTKSSQFDEVIVPNTQTVTEMGLTSEVKTDIYTSSSVSEQAELATSTETTRLELEQISEQKQKNTEDTMNFMSDMTTMPIQVVTEESLNRNLFAENTSEILNTTENELGVEINTTIKTPIPQTDMSGSITINPGLFNENSSQVTTVANDTIDTFKIETNGLKLEQIIMPTTIRTFQEPERIEPDHNILVTEPLEYSSNLDNMSPFLPEIENDTFINSLQSDEHYIDRFQNNSNLESSEDHLYTSKPPSLEHDQMNKTNPLDPNPTDAIWAHSHNISTETTTLLSLINTERVMENYRKGKAGIEKVETTTLIGSNMVEDESTISNNGSSDINKELSLIEAEQTTVEIMTTQMPFEDLDNSTQTTEDITITQSDEEEKEDDSLHGTTNNSFDEMSSSTEDLIAMETTTFGLKTPVQNSSESIFSKNSTTAQNTSEIENNIDNNSQLYSVQENVVDSTTTMRLFLLKPKAPTPQVFDTKENDSGNTNSINNIFNDTPRDAKEFKSIQEISQVKNENLGLNDVYSATSLSEESQDFKEKPVTEGFSLTGFSRCEVDQFQCVNGTSISDSGQCISNIDRCNGVNDCRDGSDELSCQEEGCPNNFRCTNGQCLKKSLVCDGVAHCSDGSDELNCG